MSISGFVLVCLLAVAVAVVSAVVGHHLGYRSADKRYNDSDSD